MASAWSPDVAISLVVVSKTTMTELFENYSQFGNIIIDNEAIENKGRCKKSDCQFI
jgi:hypothetical protein